jgi:hypothetical protein
MSNGTGERRTALLRFVNPTDIPAYRGWNFQVFGAAIALRAGDVRDVYAAYLETHRRRFRDVSKHSPRYAEAQRVAELHGLLVQACDDGRDMALDGHDYIWSFVCDLMFDRRFVSAGCPACGAEFGPESCRVLKWSFGGGLAAEGGRRVVCPAGHTLYSCGEWDS